MKRHWLVVIGIVLAARANAETLDLRAYLTARGTLASGPASWITGGFGRTSVSGDGIGESRGNAFAGAEVGIDWEPAAWLGVHVHALGRAEPAAHKGERAGIVAAYLEGRLERGNHRLQLRAGQFFLPTSRENKGDLWSSPYTLTWSALNTWMGEEVRPIGADLEHRYVTAAGHVLTSAATAFQGNDTMGTLVGWRGWSAGNRLSLYGEVLPLPPLRSLEVFPQREDGTKPFGTDLDGRTGYALRFRYALPERAMIQLTHVDNRGDRELYRGEYAWTTRFTLLGAEVGDTERTIAAIELIDGTTGMGLNEFGFVDLDFTAGYLLVSHRADRHRLSARYDVFDTTERDFSFAENNDESGRSWTFAWLVDLTPSLRGGLEFMQITGDRPAAAESGFDARMDGRTVTAELRYSFR